MIVARPDQADGFLIFSRDHNLSLISRVSEILIVTYYCDIAAYVQCDKIDSHETPISSQDNVCLHGN